MVIDVYHKIVPHLDINEADHDQNLMEFRMHSRPTGILGTTYLKVAWEGCCSTDGFREPIVIVSLRK